MPRTPSRPTRVRTIRHRAIIERLDPRHRDALQQRLRDGHRITDVRAWLRGLGCDVALSSVCRYRQDLAAEDRRRREEQDAVDDAALETCLDAWLVREEQSDLQNALDRHRVAETLLTYCELLLFESLLCLETPDDEQSFRRFLRYGDALAAVVEARARFEQRRGRCAGGQPPAVAHTERNG